MDVEPVVRFTILFVAAVVVINSFRRIVTHVVDAVRFRQAVRACARELEDERPPSLEIAAWASHRSTPVCTRCGGASFSGSCQRCEGP